MKHRFLATLLCGCILFGLMGCTGEAAPEGGMEQELPVISIPAEDSAIVEVLEQNPETVDLMDGIELMSTEPGDSLPKHPITTFGVELLQNTLQQAKKEENVLISPMSAWTVLCMVEAGANGETRKQMQEEKQKSRTE